MKNAANGGKRYAKAKALVHKGWIRLIDKAVRLKDKYGTKKEPESAVDKAVRRTAFATGLIAIFTIVLAGVGYLQYTEIRDSGVESSAQMDQMLREYRSQVAQFKRQAGDTHDLAVAARNQADAAKIQAITASRQLEVTDRPWIKIIGAVADHPVIYHTAAGITTHGNDFINLGIKVIVQNVGKSVALDVITRADVIFVSMTSGAPNNPFTYPVARQKALCSKPANFGLPINLFPGEDNREQSGDDHDIATTGKTFTVPQDPERRPRLIPYFVGCVDYKIGVSGKVRQSGFIYSVEQAIPGYANRGLLILGDDIPIADVRMERFVFGGFDAN